MAKKVGRLSESVKIQNKLLQTTNDVPIRDHITPHYINHQWSFKNFLHY